MMRAWSIAPAAVLVVGSGLLIAGCKSGSSQSSAVAPASSVDAVALAQQPPLFKGLGDHRRKITTTSSTAQRYFDQGLTLTYSFNHDEAIRSFRYAVDQDPTCAMAWWGIALCNGPHINNPVMDEDRSRAAWDAAQKAMALRDTCTPTERALIEALTARYAADATTERAKLDAAYADAMRGVWRSFPKDDDVGSLFAESMMDLRPWDLWMKDGSPQPGTEEVVATLERVLVLNPKHPGANHLYIHTVEASPRPERAIASADRLRTLVPGAGHMVHMPAHIDIRTGRWEAAATSNERAIAADAAYRELSPRQGFYNVYMAHNFHFLAFGSMMEGRKEVAMRAAKTLRGNIPPEFLRDSPALVDPVMSIHLDVMKRFGMWDEILAEPAPPATLPITTAMWRYNRGIALAAKGQASEARAEQARFRESLKAVPAEAMMAINKAHTILDIADHTLEGEIAFAEGRAGDAARELRAAVEIEDTQLYMEPPDWILPVRHALGAVLVRSGRFDEAEQVYRDDLKRWPENAWSILGLEQCARGKGETIEAAALKKRSDRAWARADIRPQTSCLCVPAK